MGEVYASIVSNSINRELRLVIRDALDSSTEAEGGPAS